MNSCLGAEVLTPDALPCFHLALVALFRNLIVKIKWRQGMDYPRRKVFQIDVYAAAAESVPVRFSSVRQRGDEPDAGYPRLASICR